MSRVAFLRNPKTQAERKQLAKAKESGVKVRGKRSNRSGLPSSWDDLSKEMGKHGWKQNKRKRQYREAVIEAILESERITLKKIQRARYQRYDAQAGENAQDVKRIASGLNMRKPKMRKYAKALYKDYV